MLVYDNRALIDVTKEFTFDSCHQLLNYNGACARLHGHTYKLQVTLRGTVNEIGMVIDFKDLKAIIKEHIVDHLDHYNLNDKLPFNTTAENMVVWMYDVILHNIQITEKYPNIQGIEVKLWETPTSFATYGGLRKCL